MYGLPPQEHADRLPAWTLRLRSAVQARERARASGHERALKRATEDVWFWVGRLTCDLLSAGNDPSLNALRKDATAAILEAGEQMPNYGYPGVTGVNLPDGGTVTHTSMQENRPYLCVAYDTEQATVQPLRLAAGLLGGPIVMYASRKLPEDEAMLRAVTFLVGAGMSYWSLWVWNKADKAMRPQE